jgi:LmbE family N-acetylglucosaminyl deacetylase
MNSKKRLSVYMMKPLVWILVCTLIIPLTILFFSAKVFKLQHTEESAFTNAPQRLLIVFAHTDDEVTNAGLIRHWANQGTEIKILTLTDGSANPDSDLSVCLPTETITQCRMRELADSARFLGIRHIKTPLLPDSKLIDHLPQATRIVEEELDTFKPEAVLTMEPSGLNGLSDHRAAFLAVAGASSKAAHQFKTFLSVLPPPFVWILKSKIPAAFEEQLQVFPTNSLLIESKVSVAAAHRSQAATIRGLTLGLGAERLFSWINFETYSVHKSEVLEQLNALSN